MNPFTHIRSWMATVAAALVTLCTLVSVAQAETYVYQNRSITTPTIIQEDDVWIIRGTLNNFDLLINKGKLHILGEFQNRSTATFDNRGALWGAINLHGPRVGRVNNVGTVLSEGGIFQFEAHTFINSGVLRLTDGAFYVHGLTNTNDGRLIIHDEAGLAAYTRLNNQSGGVIHNYGFIYVGDLYNQAQSRVSNFGDIYEWFDLNGDSTIFNNGTFYSCGGFEAPEVVGNAVLDGDYDPTICRLARRW